MKYNNTVFRTRFCITLYWDIYIFLTTMYVIRNVLLTQEQIHNYMYTMCKVINSSQHNTVHYNI